MWPELGILLVVLLSMTTKPVDGGTKGFWVAVVLILGGSALLAARGLRDAHLSASHVSSGS